MNVSRTALADIPLEAEGTNTEGTHVSNLHSQPDPHRVYQCAEFTVVTHGDSVRLEANTSKVLILPYVTDESDMIDRLGVVIRSVGEQPTLMCGSIRPNDPDVLSSAIEVLYDQTAMRIREPESWEFLGLMRIRGLANEVYPCFAVNMTEVATDKNKKRLDRGFFFLSLPDTIDSEDVLIHAAFLKLFRSYYRNDKF